MTRQLGQWSRIVGVVANRGKDNMDCVVSQLTATAEYGPFASLQLSVGYLS